MMSDDIVVCMHVVWSVSAKREPCTCDKTFGLWSVRGETKGYVLNDERNDAVVFFVAAALVRWCLTDFSRHSSACIFCRLVLETLPTNGRHSKVKRTRTIYFVYTGHFITKKSKNGGGFKTRGFAATLVRLCFEWEYFVLIKYSALAS